MDLRSIPEHLTSNERINQRRTLIERELKIDLSRTVPAENAVGEAEKKNCEQMFGVVALPVGYAGPLCVQFSSKQKVLLHLPLATTEGALVASVNRGAKAVSVDAMQITRVTDHGITRSIAFAGSKSVDVQRIMDLIRKEEPKWKQMAEATSGHLKVLGYDVDVSKQYVFLTIRCGTDEAMGMNMVTIAAQAAADCLISLLPGLKCVTIAGNVDSDKKPSRRTHERGRGFEVLCEAVLSAATIAEVLKTTPEAMLAVADAKLKHGSKIAGAIGSNLHAANIVAALYLATGQDIAHCVEGSLADTEVSARGDGIVIQVRMPAILVGVRGGGTGLPAQAQYLEMLLKNKAGMHVKQQLAETVAAAVLAGEVSLLAAQASHTLASSHKELAR